MAPPSPRRSSRARPINNALSQNSSVSSGTSGRLDRNARSNNKPASGKSTPSTSLSSEPPDDLEYSLLNRRRKRGQDEEQDKVGQIVMMGIANGNDDLQDEEDEAVRCICGSDEYPGLPPVEGPDAEFFAAIELTDDVTGFFVQCDICKVWQHGACVGIFTAESSPDEYFCEQCRKDLHKIHSATNGQKYSKFLPLHRHQRTTSRGSLVVKDGARSPKTGNSKSNRLGSASLAAKRRCTMNSRDAAYDDELLRRVIEASKEDVPTESGESLSRRAKRGRSDSDEHISMVKRQRTGSRSVSPARPAEQPDTSAGGGSDDESNTRNGSKKNRHSRNQREKSEKEDRDRQRQEAASKRKGRAERRRAEGVHRIRGWMPPGLTWAYADSDLSEETPLAVAKLAQAKGVEQAATDESPTATQPPGTPPMSQSRAASAQKKGPRSSHKRGKGRNQYSRDRDQDGDESRVRSTSRDLSKNADETCQPKGSAFEGKYGSKGKLAAAGKMSMLDMKRRVGAIMEFISRTQLDLAAENGSSSSGGETPQRPEPSRTNGDAAADDEHPDGPTTDGEALGEGSAKGFKELNCMEMMDVLTRDMVKWQNQYS
ncbi:transcriptional regulator Cti6 [Drechmeria coniospora]|uniref:Transcriptional regulator Cti6 n=1 Tax=Drechmeria coniospora TaxID=98403 RepID=A0A151GSA9_DRECN|nr:transcriptional regulator Cti6 [Drechmeria coniospora]KYK59953.1 transcriptional regulator Cti6 [Drechmeria coniospora]ODA78748.1 hypothetical protein RJ55_06131 [Drechmeria coniospora]